MGAPISCGGVQVKTGNLVIGDDDGITVVPKARMVEVLAACQDTLKAEAEWHRRIKSGEVFADILDLTPKEPAP